MRTWGRPSSAPWPSRGRRWPPTAILRRHARGLRRRSSSAGAVAERAPSPVTIAAKCHQPITYVDDVPVDTVTKKTYLAPALDPSCAGVSPPSNGRLVLPGIDGSRSTGELVWPSVGEFGRGPWSSAPRRSWPATGRVRLRRRRETPFASFGFPNPASLLRHDARRPGGTAPEYGASRWASVPGNPYALRPRRASSRTTTTAGESARVRALSRWGSSAASPCCSNPTHRWSASTSPATTLFNRAAPPFSRSLRLFERGRPGPPALVAPLIDFGVERVYAAATARVASTAFPPRRRRRLVRGHPGARRHALRARAVRCLAASAATGTLRSPTPLSVVAGDQTTWTPGDPLTISGFLGIPVLAQPSTRRVEQDAGGLGPLAEARPDRTSPSFRHLVEQQIVVIRQIVAPGSATSPSDLPDI